MSYLLLHHVLYRPKAFSHSSHSQPYRIPVPDDSEFSPYALVNVLSLHFLVGTFVRFATF